MATISRREYFEIYGRHLPVDETKALFLSRYLHDLGVFLHFQDDPLLARTVFLQNQWVTEAVYRILDDEQVKGARGRFSEADVQRLWRGSGYDDMHPELRALMLRFELCYSLPDNHPSLWIAPQLLPPTRPAALGTWNQPDDLVLRYSYDFLPKGVISRLTVRLHRYVREPELAWTTGVLLEHEGTQVLAQVLPTGAGVELRARGSERKAFLSVVAADLDALNHSLPGLREKVDKLIPCNCSVCRQAPEPEFFSEKALRRRKEVQRLRVQCEESFEDVDVLALLDGNAAYKLPAWAKAAQANPPLRIVPLFLASSKELAQDRDAFDLFLRRENDRLTRSGVYLEPVRWEHFLDAMSETRLQDEYDKKIERCDLFVCLFHTKAGKLTEEEFEVAHRAFKESGRPRLFTYFKQDATKLGQIPREDVMSLWAFQDKLKQLGHYQSEYEGIDQLKLKFREQLDHLLDEGLPSL